MTTPSPAPASQPSTQAAAEREAFEAIIERDRSTVAEGVTAIGRAISNFDWLQQGRGSYEWNDDRWKDEFGNAVDAILEALEPLRRVAADLSNSPRSSEAVRKARSPQAALRTPAATLQDDPFHNSDGAFGSTAPGNPVCTPVEGVREKFEAWWHGYYRRSDISIQMKPLAWAVWKSCAADASKALTLTEEERRDIRVIESGMVGENGIVVSDLRKTVTCLLAIIRRLSASTADGTREG